MKTIINMLVITICVVAVVFCCYKLVTAECSYLNYIYLAGVAIATMIGGEKILKSF
ncbi:MAG: hypothetical protein II937_13535 [Bacteroidales bacterium]|nr:hypothetical protein [Bacteroidales bacterium]